MPFGEKLFGFQHFGALHMANFNGDILNGAGHNAERGEEGCVSIARDDLRADGFWFQPQLRANMLFNGRVDIGKGANRAGNRARGNLITGRAHARQVAIHFRIEPRKG